MKFTVAIFQTRSRKSSRGVYLVLIALFLGFLGIFVASMVGLGMLSNAKIGAQNATNLASLACLDAFTETVTTDPTTKFQLQAEACRDAVIQVLQENKVVATEDPAGLSTSDVCFETSVPHCAADTPVRLTLGHYYVQNQLVSPAESCPNGVYPCFVANDQVPGADPALTADAVRIQTIKHETVHAWSRLVTQGRDLQEVGSAAIVPRCVAFLIDISSSTAFETHLPWTGIQYKAGDAAHNIPPASCNMVCPADDISCGSGWTYFDSAYPQPMPSPVPAPACPPNGPNFTGNDTRPEVYVNNPPGYVTGLPSYSYWTAAPGSTDCLNSSNLNSEQVFWCNMPARRPDPLDVTQPYPAGHPKFGQIGYRSINDPDFARYHYQSDFLNVPGLPGGYYGLPADIGTMFLDLMYIERNGKVYYGGPEPFTSFFLAFNASLRAMQNFASNADQAVVMPFSLSPRNPEPLNNMTKSTDDLGYLVQLTNLDNGGRVDYDPTRAPAYDWVPGKGIYQPNYISKGWIVMQRPGYEQVDGMTNLVGAVDEAIVRMQSCPSNSKKVIILATDGVSTCSRPTPGVQNYNCKVDYDIYSTAQDELLGDVLDSLRSNGIALSVLFSGASVAPHILNRTFPNGQGGFMDSSDARAYGYCGGISSKVCACGQPDCRFVDQTSDDGQGHVGTSKTEHRFAFNAIANPGVTFGEPAAALNDLAFGSGGDFCPLLPQCDANAAANTPAAPNNPAGCDNGTCYTDPDGSGPLPGRLKDAARIAGAKQSCSVNDLTMSEQAARCTTNAVTGSSFILIPDK